MSSETMRLLCSSPGASPEAMRAARASATAVLPTPGSPTRTGLFLARRESICRQRPISASLPTTGSSPPSAAMRVRSRPNWSRVFVSMRLDGLLTGRAVLPRGTALRGAEERPHRRVELPGAHTASGAGRPARSSQARAAAPAAGARCRYSRGRAVRPRSRPVPGRGGRCP